MLIWILLQKIIDGTVIFTDEYIVYNNIATKQVNRSRKKYVIGNAHTNTVEFFWALFKRGYIGIYYSMSKKHLQGFINEFVYRINNKILFNYKLVEKALTNIEGHLSYRSLVNG